MNSRCLNSEQVKAEAQNLGFCACGIARACDVDASHAHFFLKWLQCGCEAEMGYMRNHVEMRLRPSLLVSDVHSIVCVALNYRPAQKAPYLSMYAQGRDYHDVMRQRMNLLMSRIGGTGRCFTDTAPVLERYWAWKSGLGWIGRNTLLNVPGIGSTVFLGELFLAEETDHYDTPITSQIPCHACNRCVKGCPHQALGEEGVDARRCQSYLTIEHRGTWKENFHPQECFYGCDHCQNVCPHQGKVIGDVEFQPSSSLLEMTSEAWKNLTKGRYQELFKGSAVKRAKYEGLMRNIQAFEKE